MFDTADTQNYIQRKERKEKQKIIIFGCPICIYVYTFIYMYK